MPQLLPPSCAPDCLSLNPPAQRHEPGGFLGFFVLLVAQHALFNQGITDAAAQCRTEPSVPTFGVNHLGPVLRFAGTTRVKLAQNSLGALRFFCLGQANAIRLPYAFLPL